MKPVHCYSALLHLQIVHVWAVKHLDLCFTVLVFCLQQTKQRCEVLEEQLVNLVVSAMEHSENSDGSTDPGLSHLMWQHLSSQLIYFVLFQFASFPHMVVSLYDKVRQTCFLQSHL